jgi:muramoyltetrapeptide carboxypeptidase LdcA involved in peptidoglycan recycling
VRVPPKLVEGDEIRVLALSRSLGGAFQQAGFTERDVEYATRCLNSLGLSVSFGRHVYECNAHLTASLQHRLEDFHEALVATSVKAVLAVTGGSGAMQLLDGLDYDFIVRNPKILCGYSDVGLLCNAICIRAGVVTYYGPNFTSFMMRDGAEYTLSSFQECLFGTLPTELRPAEKWSDDAWHKDQENRTYQANEGPWVLQSGEADGAILGGSYWCLNIQQGSNYFPSLENAVLFLEGPAEGRASLMSLDCGLRSLAFQPAFGGVRGIVLGRFARNGRVTRENLTELIRAIPALAHLPVVANCDFGHTTPIATVPIGGRCTLMANVEKVSIVFNVH